VENEIELGRNTVIGKNVTILPGAVLTLDVDDIIPPHENQPNKFTPAQAWVAAGQGHLVIGTGGSTPGTPENAFADALPLYNYTVAELLTGVYPNASRTYTVTSGRIAAEELPALIPQGAAILTRANPTKSDGNTLTINGSLTTNGTLNEITKIEVGNGGSLALANTDGELLRGLVDLKLGPGANLAVVSTEASLESLETLFLGDGSNIAVPGGHVTFNEDEPLALTLGKKITYNVPMSQSARIDTVISKTAGLVNSTFIIRPGSTFTVEKDVTFTVEGSTFDISNMLLIPAAGEDPSVKIDGTLEIAGVANSVITGPNLAAVQADPGVLYKIVDLGTNGKVVLNYGAQFLFGTDVTKFVGATADTATYEWAAAADGAQIEINDKGLVIRDTDTTAGAVVTIGAAGAFILADQILTLERDAALALGTGTLSLLGDAATSTNGGGAILLGPGRVTSGTVTIAGGDFGWQAVGDNINLTGAASTITVTAASLVTPPPATIAASLKALGLGAAITAGAATDTLAIAADTTVDLNGTMSREKGVINLGASGAKITLAAASEILTGAAPASHAAPVALGAATTVAAGAVTGIGVTGLTGANVASTSETLAETTAVPPDPAATTGPVGNLVSLSSGATLPGTVTASAAVSIHSMLQTLADTTP
ncbi:MAG: hypothetical protein LBK83_03125, partial [Treponema sp.]|jgi:hypothetical protein|nr:hypothetical protein [Treponema sp.]